MSDAVLAAAGIYKSFPGVRALQNVDFKLRSGEVHAVLGENGAGKSTLIKILTGVHQPDAGEILLNGEIVAPRSTSDAESLGISTVYQEVNLVPELSVAENILLGRQPKRFGFLDWRAINRRAREAVGRLGLDIDVTQPVRFYSMAVQQMIAIARALDVDARALILDEPTSSLDEQEVDELFRVIRQLRADGLGIVFITHFLDQVYAVSDRITVLRNGEFVGEYLTSELPRLQLIGKMLGREIKEASRTEPAETSSVEEAESSMIDVRQLGRSKSLHPVDLSVRKGEVVGLAGLLGSGRTELARLLFGADKKTSGSMAVDGEAVAITSPARAISSGIAFCSEDRKSEGIIPTLSVRDNLILAMQARRGVLKRVPLAKQTELANHYISALKIKTPTSDTPIQNLSGGNQQKVLLARWLCLQPKLIILDEPTRGIDIGAKGEIEKLVVSLRDEGMSCLFISSELEEVVRVSQRVAVMRDRRKAGELCGADMNENRILEMIAAHE